MYNSKFEGWYVADCIRDMVGKRCMQVFAHSNATSGQWVKLAKFQLIGNEKTALGMLTLVNRTGNNSMGVQSFWFAGWSNHVEAKTLQKHGNTIVNELRVCYDADNSWWLEGRMQIPVEAVAATPNGLYNCEVSESFLFEVDSTSTSTAQCAMI